MTEQVLIVDEPAPHVRRLTLNRPERLNAMTAELCEALHAALREIGRDRSCRAVDPDRRGPRLLRRASTCAATARRRATTAATRPATGSPTSSTCRGWCSRCARSRSR